MNKHLKFFIYVLVIHIVALWVWFLSAEPIERGEAALCYEISCLAFSGVAAIFAYEL